MADTAARILPPTAQTDLNGQAREFPRFGRSIYLTFVLELMFILPGAVGAIRKLSLARSSSCCRCRCR